MTPHRGVSPAIALDRSLGALLGLAVGDALGASVEGRTRDSYPRLRDFEASAAHGLEAGEWTDDTAMALCLGDSLLAARPFDPRDLLERFCRWYRFGENAARGQGIGISERTRATLEAFEGSGRIDAAASAVNAGNGCIMRLAPVAIMHRYDVGEAERVATAQALATHTAEEAVAATVLFSGMLVAALSGGDVETALARSPSASHPALADLAGGAFRTKHRDEISSAPRAVDTLEAALWCVARAETFESAVVEAVNLGGDADTIGAVAGQLSGALLGASAIPERWLEGLHARERLAEMARRFHAGA
jgi:ADP-ribosyl-[dinitrogen reductase] hydrolase